MSAGVFTPELRFRFVSKSLSEVGDGTAWPMLVTRDQLAEIMYRVKDAQWVSGSADMKFGMRIFEEGEIVGVEWQTAAGIRLGWPDMPEPLVNYEYSDPDTFYSRRGYCTIARGASPTTPMSGSFGFGETYYVGPTVAGDIYTIAAREAITERALWANGGTYAMEDAPSVGMAHQAIPGDGFRTGFSFYGASEIVSGDYPSRYIPYTEFVEPNKAASAAVSLDFSGEVAWVDVDESGNPFSPGNQLYVGVEFIGNLLHPWTDGVIQTNFFSTNIAVLDEEWGEGLAFDTGAKVRLKLSGEDNYITAKIYGIAEELFFTAVAFDYVSDFDFEPTEWWPYAKGNPPVPVWDSSDGTPL
jgi:hypothetical protein